MNIGTQDMKCNCSSSAFKYEPLGHVITGNLRIIQESKLREKSHAHILAKYACTHTHTHTHTDEHTHTRSLADLAKPS